MSWLAFDWSLSGHCEVQQRPMMTARDQRQAPSWWRTPLALLAPLTGDGVRTDVHDELPRAALPDVSPHGALLLRLDGRTIGHLGRGAGGTADFPCVFDPGPGGNEVVFNGLPTAKRDGRATRLTRGISRTRLPVEVDNITARGE